MKISEASVSVNNSILGFHTRFICLAGQFLRTTFWFFNENAIIYNNDIPNPYNINLDDYGSDIVERYRHGEMFSADSIRTVDSLKYVTPKGKTVYGGGGIIPDVFVPIDTVGVTDFLIASNRKSLIVKYSNVLADKYRGELREVKDFEGLERLISKIDLEGGFLEFAQKNGVVPKRGEWEESKNVIIQQLCGLFGRFSVLDDNAFYPYILKVDNVVEKVKELEKEK